MQKIKSFVLNNYLTRRILYLIGTMFIYLVPIVIIAENITIVKEIKIGKVQAVSITGCVLGLLYLLFLSKHFKNKILNLKPGAFKSFISGVISLIPVIVLACFIQLVQDFVNKLPEIDIAKIIWTIIFSIIIGLCLQVIDAAINKKYLYQLEITREAKRSVDIERRRQELTNELENELQ